MVKPTHPRKRTQSSILYLAATAVCVTVALVLSQREPALRDVVEIAARQPPPAMEEAYLAARRALDRIDDTSVEYANDGGSEWVLGALINVVGNVLINLGTNVVKMGHNHDEQTARLGVTSGRGRGCLLRSGGWLLFVVGSAMNFVSFSFAAQSLLAALGAVQFVSNAVFAKYCLGEAVSRRTILATGGIVFGILLVISSASHRNAVHTVPELLDLYLAPAYRAPPAAASARSAPPVCPYRAARALSLADGAAHA